MDNIHHFLNGAISGAFGVALSHPIDTIKSNIQDNKRVSFNPRYLYRGLVPALSGVGFEKAIVFGTYENTRRLLDNDTRFQNNRRANIATAGALSGFTASLVVAPTERLKILSQTGTKIGPRHFHPNILFRGLSATFTREVPGFAIYFSTYEHLKHTHTRDTGETLPLSASFVYGGASGAIAWAGIYPQDMIKTRMQAIQDLSVKPTFIGTAKQIYVENGIRGYFRGFHLALLRAVPLHSGTFMMMEIMKRHNGP
jgi:solute carrier family 25 (mitochondrial carnitine/acylcarnitine transporter), member 20/29